MSNIIAKVVSQKGTCEAGHRVGDEFIIGIGQKTPPGICSWAFNTLFPFAEVLQFGGSFPCEKDPNKAIIACLVNPIVVKTMGPNINRKTVDIVSNSGLILERVTELAIGIFKLIEARKKGEEK